MKIIIWAVTESDIRKFKHQMLTQTQTVITLEFSLPNIWKTYVALKC